MEANSLQSKTVIYTFEDFELDRDKLELRRNGLQIALEPQVFELLYLLVENHHRVVSKDELRIHVWKGRVISDSVIGSRMSLVRAALDDDGREQRLIKTQHGRGYRFVGSARGISHGDSVVTALSQRGLGAVEDNGSVASPSHTDVTIAILPFANLSAEFEQAYLVDGIGEEIATTLGKIPSLRVLARNATVRYGSQLPDLERIGRELGATHVLQGSVRTSKRRVRVTAELIRITDSFLLWGDQSEQTFTDVFDLQDEIARKVVAALHIELVAGERAVYWARGTRNFNAWKVQLLAMQLVSSHDQSLCSKGRALAKQAAEVDDAYSEPWSTLGVSYHMDLVYGWSDSPERIVALATIALEQALDRNPENPLALVTLGCVKTMQRQYSPGYDLCRQGLALGSDSLDVASVSIMGCVLAGKFDVVENRVAEMQSNWDQLDPWHRTILVGYHFFCGDQEAAVAMSQSILERDPGYPFIQIMMASALVDNGLLEEARHAVATALRANPCYSIQHAAFAFAYRERALADQILRNLQKAGVPNNPPS